MLQLLEILIIHHRLCYSSRTADASRDYQLSTRHLLSDIHGAASDLNGGDIEPRLRFDVLPGFGSHHVVVRVHFAVAVLITEAATSGRSFPVRIIWIDQLSGMDT